MEHKAIILVDDNPKDPKTVSDSKGQCISSTNEQSDQSSTCTSVFNWEKKRKENRCLPVSLFMKQIC